MGPPRPSQSRLFDASALVNLLISRGGSALDAARGSSTLDLALYEAGNALWKLSTLHHNLSPAEADSLHGALVRMALNHMNLIGVSELDHPSVSKLARAERITYYDAAYICAAKDRRCELITDDGRLARAARSFLVVKDSSAL